MSEINTGGPAFPIMPPLDGTGRSAVGYPYPSEGASLRDYFAAKAMQGILSAFDSGDEPLVPELARIAYEVADGMIAAREAKS